MVGGEGSERGDITNRRSPICMTPMFLMGFVLAGQAKWMDLEVAWGRIGWRDGGLDILSLCSSALVSRWGVELCGESGERE